MAPETDKSCIWDDAPGTTKRSGFSSSFQSDWTQSGNSTFNEPSRMRRRRRRERSRRRGRVMMLGLVMLTLLALAVAAMLWTAPTRSPLRLHAALDEPHSTAATPFVPPDVRG